MAKRFSSRVLALCLLWFGFAATAGADEMAPDFSTVAITPANEALTLARVTHEGEARLMAVTSYERGTVTGKVLAGLPDDPIDAFQALGYEGLASAIESAEITTQVQAAELLMPVSLGDRHIAAGTNFPEHAEEATVEDGPFLFPKAVQPTGAYAPVFAGLGLLDFEVELCFVGFEPIDLDAPPAHVGLFLCNDYTDRAKLMRHLDPFDVTSGKGFTTGKSAPGFMPIGNLFVIPHDRQSFAPKIELSLYLNEERQQHAFQRQAIWDFEEILRQIAARRDVTWEYEGARLGLSLEDGDIPLRTAILGGTPSGTLFQGLSLSQQVSGAFQWLAGGWDKSVVHWIIEAYVEEAQEARSFLQPGDSVTIHADRLGVISNEIAE